MEDSKFPKLPLLKQFFQKHVLLRANVEAMQLYYTKRLSVAKRERSGIPDLNRDEYSFTATQVADLQVRLLEDFLEYVKSL